MAIFSDFDEQISVLRDLLGTDAAAEDLAHDMLDLDDAQLVAAIGSAATLARCAERISIVGAGIAAARSSRERGHSGLAQSRGHRSPASLLQELTGTSRAEARKQVRLGESLLSVGEDHHRSNEENDADSASSPGMQEFLPWHSALSEALLRDSISSTQHDAILRGLDAPPDDSGEARHACAAASEQLVLEAAERTPEELLLAARSVRDLLDPAGADRRFAERFERRSYRMWTDADGVDHGSFCFDPETSAWVRTILDTALRPRRGGPRFVDAAERSDAAALAADPRTNDQLAYDLLIDVLRAGTLADADAVFGARQAGVRLVQVVDVDGCPVGIVHTEDGLVTLPSSLAEQRICESGTVRVSIDRDGNPLDVGREQRLFTSRQRIALAIRDGGCRWKGCDRPSSYCEAHHIDPYSEGGRTDIERGVLLCRFHHLQLHNGGWRITRTGAGDFVLHDSAARSTVLASRLVLGYAWAGLDPPPRRFVPAA